MRTQHTVELDGTDMTVRWFGEGVTPPFADFDIHDADGRLTIRTHSFQEAVALRDAADELVYAWAAEEQVA